MCENPEDYRWCSYAAAVGGDVVSRRGLARAWGGQSGHPGGVSTGCCCSDAERKSPAGRQPGEDGEGEGRL
ncbi:MAG: hypothetical protein R3F19_32410 [Verrucomicrobiales bacterium]